MKYTKKDFDKLCVVCEHAREICDEDNMLCEIRGIVGKSYFCKKFVYDPLKRMPPRAQKIPPMEFVSLDDEEAKPEPADNTEEADVTDVKADTEQVTGEADDVTAGEAPESEPNGENTEEATETTEEQTEQDTTAQTASEEEN